MRKPKLEKDIKPVSEHRANAGLLRDVQTAANEIESGKGIPHREAKAELRRRFRC